MYYIIADLCIYQPVMNRKKIGKNIARPILILIYNIVKYVSISSYN